MAVGRVLLGGLLAVVAGLNAVFFAYSLVVTVVSPRYWHVGNIVSLVVLAVVDTVMWMGALVLLRDGWPSRHAR